MITNFDRLETQKARTCLMQRLETILSDQSYFFSRSEYGAMKALLSDMQKNHYEERRRLEKK